MHLPLDRRTFLKGSLLTLSVIASGSLISCAPAAAPAIGLKIVSPSANAKVAGPKVKVEAEVSGLALVDANIAPKDGEGHLHFFVDAPATAIAVGQAIPADQPAKYVHLGKTPYTSREIELSKGQHTITVVATNAAHVVLAQPAPVSVTFSVE
jgi:hypothetical protein